MKRAAVRNLPEVGTKGTKQVVAEKLAKLFPDELASQVPPKRKLWKAEDFRMTIFDAVALVVAHRRRQAKRRKKSLSHHHVVTKTPF